ncbi:MAG: four helix bundle protein [Candidatus Cloacimonetes bacterium]|nr:four helix bundle protein [Candidatus Cloacimonadota bacterium]
MSKKIEKFEDYDVWKISMRLTLNIYRNLKECRDFGLRDQMQRAAVSIPSNFSEGYKRQSNKEFIRFLYIAKGSCAELRTQLYLASELNIIEKSISNGLIKETLKISGMLTNLIIARKEKF